MTSDAAKIAQLEEWMKGKEGETLGFQEAKGGFHFENLCKYCCALANEGGGQIILGVTETRLVVSWVPKPSISPDVLAKDSASAFPLPSISRKSIIPIAAPPAGFWSSTARAGRSAFPSSTRVVTGCGRRTA
jgi:hypothetical protein